MVNGYQVKQETRWQSIRTAGYQVKKQRTDDGGQKGSEYRILNKECRMMKERKR